MRRSFAQNKTPTQVEIALICEKKASAVTDGPIGLRCNTGDRHLATDNRAFALWIKDEKEIHIVFDAPRHYMRHARMGLGPIGDAAWARSRDDQTAGEVMCIECHLLSNCAAERPTENIRMPESQQADHLCGHLSQSGNRVGPASF